MDQIGRGQTWDMRCSMQPETAKIKAYLKGSIEA